MKAVPYQEKYKKALQDIHMATASEKARTDESHGKFSLLMYCDEYLDKETAFVLLDEEDRLAGYILCAENASVWAENMKPYITEIEKLGAPYDQMVHRQIEEYQQAQPHYPAHLHIDILEEYTGKHGGSLLMNTLLEHLRTAHVKGVCLGVARKNERAFGFYRHFGFEILAEDEGGWFLGLSLEQF